MLQIHISEKKIQEINNCKKFRFHLGISLLSACILEHVIKNKIFLNFMTLPHITLFQDDFKAFERLHEYSLLLDWAGLCYSQTPSQIDHPGDDG